MDVHGNAANRIKFAVNTWPRVWKQMHNLPHATQSNSRHSKRSSFDNGIEDGDNIEKFFNLYKRDKDNGILVTNITSSSAVAERPRSMVDRFGWVVGDGVAQTMVCTKCCRWQKTKSIDLLHNKSIFIRKTVTFGYWAPLRGLGATYAVHLIGSWESPWTSY